MNGRNQSEKNDRNQSEKSYKNQSEKCEKTDYDPNFRTFPLAGTVKTEKDSNVSLPSEDAVSELREWVDFKEM